MTFRETEANILERIVPDLEAQGYEVYVRPSRLVTPSFLGDGTPAAVAFRSEKNAPSDKNLIIEIARQSEAPQKKLDAMAKLVAAQRDWELRLFWISSSSKGEELRVQSAEAIAKRIDEVRQLVDDGHIGPALLLAWAILEAQTRSLETAKVVRPQTTARIIETLAAGGHVTPDEADMLRKIAGKRNALAHGEFAVDLTHEDVDRVTGILKTLQVFVPA